MKQLLRLTVGFLVLGALAVAANPAQAVDAVGPYYAEPAWDQSLLVAPRFVVLTNWGSAAVLDKETGLVWEKSPSAVTKNWAAARRVCTAKTTGARKGWRLPSIHELTSLLHPSGFTPGGPTLQPGHPFLTAQPANYWSATTNAHDIRSAWFVSFFSGGVSDFGKSDILNVWCVRGGGVLSEY
jgi:hypothetical protein